MVARNNVLLEVLLCDWICKNRMFRLYVTDLNITRTEIQFIANLTLMKATLVYHPDMPSIWLQIARSTFTDSFYQLCQTMLVHYRACGVTEEH